MNILSLMSLTLLLPSALAAESNDIPKPSNADGRKVAYNIGDGFGTGPQDDDIFVVKPVQHFKTKPEFLTLEEQRQACRIAHPDYSEDECTYIIIRGEPLGKIPRCYSKPCKKHRRKF